MILYLVGISCVGKTTIGKMLSEEIGFSFFDIDIEIQKYYNKPIERIQDDCLTMNQSQIHGFFDDEGYEINTELIKKPSLCITCTNNDNPNEELLCNMNRYNQRNDKEFKCFAYKKDNWNLNYPDKITKVKKTKCFITMRVKTVEWLVWVSCYDNGK